MQSWEYLRATAVLRETYLSVIVGQGDEVELVDVDAYLAARGAEGWELVAVVGQRFAPGATEAVGSTTLVTGWYQEACSLFFKRPEQQGEG
jgi:hypothetical protein